MRLTLSAFVGLLTFTALAIAAPTPDGPPPCPTCDEPDCIAEDYDNPSHMHPAKDLDKTIIEARYKDDDNKVIVTIASSASDTVPAERVSVESRITEASLVTLENTPLKPAAPVIYFVIAPHSKCTLDLVKAGFTPAKKSVATLYEKGRLL
jgi:hypothetical protein